MSAAEADVVRPLQWIDKPENDHTDGETKAAFVDTLELPGWCIDYDRAATITGYAQISVGGPEKCNCDACRNWALTRDAILPREMRALLDRLGVPCGKECEVYHVCRLQSGLHSYGGWYHFVGCVNYGEKEVSPNVAIGPFSMYFFAGGALLPKPFDGLHTVQLDFVAEVPWLSNVPEAP